LPGQGPADVVSCFEVLGTGKAVGKQGVGNRSAVARQIKLCSQLQTVCIIDFQFLSIHVVSFLCFGLMGKVTQ